jgi:Flp pilus assembly secretin CpaC
MKHLIVLIAAIATLVLGTSAHATEESVSVAVGRVTIVRSPHVIATVAVGDPAIADVVAEGENAVLVFGKKSGRTDLVLMDGSHRLLRKSPIVVGPSGDDTIIVRRPDERGIGVDSWVCAPTCAKVGDK